MTFTSTPRISDQPRLDCIKDVVGGAELKGDLIGSADAGISAREGQDFALLYAGIFERPATEARRWLYTDYCFSWSCAKPSVALYFSLWSRVRRKAGDASDRSP